VVGHEFTGRGDQSVEERPGCIYRDNLKDAPGNIENRPVIDFQNPFPVLKHLVFTDAAPFAPKFSKSGRPVIRVAKPIADSVKLVRDNFAANLVSYAEGVAQDNPEGFEAIQKSAHEAGEPIATQDRANMDRAIAEAMEKSIAEARAKARKVTKAPKQERVAVTA